MEENRRANKFGPEPGSYEVEDEMSESATGEADEGHVQDGRSPLLTIREPPQPHLGLHVYATADIGMSMQPKHSAQLYAYPTGNFLSSLQADRPFQRNRNVAFSPIQLQDLYEQTRKNSMAAVGKFSKTKLV